ncbi:MAG TPA: hypothetical protein VGB57_05605, partial [Allosphingosinicella sp.]
MHDIRRMLRSGPPALARFLCHALAGVLILLGGTILLAGGIRSAHAQGLNDLVPRQEFRDANGVDMDGAIYRHHEALLRIGNGPHPLALNLHISSPGPEAAGVCPASLSGDVGNAIYHALDSHAYFGNTAIGTALFTVVLPHQSAKFAIYGSGFNRTIVPSDAAYVTAAFDATNVYLDYVGGDGAEATFSQLHTPLRAFQDQSLSHTADRVRYPDGETWIYRYNDVQYAAPGCPSIKVSRVRSIVSSRGYGLQFNYAADAGGTVTSSSVVRDFVSPIRVAAYNKASVFCDESALLSCASVNALSTAVAFAYDRTNRKVTVSKANGEQVELAFSLGATLNLTGVTRPGGASRTMTYREWEEQEGPTYRTLENLTEAGRTWSYGWGPMGAEAVTTVIEPGNATTAYHFIHGMPSMILDPLGRETLVGYDDYSRLLRRRAPEGNELTASYDVRGNLNLLKEIPKPGSGLPTLQSSAFFPPGCTAADRRRCNRPTSVTDRRSNTTDYTYSPDHGGVLTETGPAVPSRQADGSLASVRPQKRYEYAQRQAWVSNGTGGYVQAAPVWLLVRERYCRITSAIGPSCAGGAADEVVT